MSANVVSKGVIDVIVQQGIAEGVLDPAEARQVGKSLWFENVVSVCTRYAIEPDTEEGQRYVRQIDGYTFTGTDQALDPAVVQAQLRCYQYQSAEHDGWATSDSARLTTALLATMDERHGEDLWTRDGNHRWGVQTIEEAVAR